jgi:O-6-methylguanine DNA methyltransferase
MSEFAVRVLIETALIPEGETRSYSELAKRIGKPYAYRAVGNALNRNPFPRKIPCHRVIRSDGTIGGYVFGTKRKRTLLANERGKL